jgi:hypothetical protein
MLNKISQVLDLKCWIGLAFVTLPYRALWLLPENKWESLGFHFLAESRGSVEAPRVTWFWVHFPCSGSKSWPISQLWSPMLLFRWVPKTKAPIAFGA